MSQATMSGVINGVDVDRMGTTVQAVQQNPSLAAFQFRATNRVDERLPRKWNAYCRARRR